MRKERKKSQSLKEDYLKDPRYSRVVKLDTAFHTKLIFIKMSGILPILRYGNCGK
jgi:hypothetical protein